MGVPWSAAASSSLLMKLNWPQKRQNSHRLSVAMPVISLPVLLISRRHCSMLIAQPGRYHLGCSDTSVDPRITEGAYLASWYPDDLNLGIHQLLESVLDLTLGQVRV